MDAKIEQIHAKMGRDKEIEDKSQVKAAAFLAGFLDNYKHTLVRTSRTVQSGWKALVPQVMTSVLFTSKTLM